MRNDDDNRRDGAATPSLDDGATVILHAPTDPAVVRPSGPPNAPDIAVTVERGPETRTTAFSGPSCEECGRVLTGRKTRFCSDRCRMRDRRRHQQLRRLDLLDTIMSAVADLCLDLNGDDDEPDLTTHAGEIECRNRRTK